jgi:hypothetical protein
VTRFLPLCAVLLLLPAIARAVPLPTGDTALSGTTLAQRPELAGEVVEDQLIPYSFQGAGSSVSGVIKNRVVRSVDGTLKFYWRIIPDASSTGDIIAFRVGGFGGFTLDGDFHLDSPGSVGPATARNFGDGSVNFLFSHGVSAGESSFFFFLDTQATAFSNTGSYDLLSCSDNGCISPLFTTFAPALAPPSDQPPAPGWYRNSGPGTFYEDGSWRIVWKRSYVYPYLGDVPLYWYAQVKYLNIGSQTLSISCSGGTDLPPVREHMRGIVNGSVDAAETFCDRNPGWTGSVNPGEAYYDWAIFHNVPSPGVEVSLEWQPYGFSAWVNPWFSHFSAPPPAECPPELVTLGTCGMDDQQVDQQSGQWFNCKWTEGCTFALNHDSTQRIIALIDTSDMVGLYGVLLQQCIFYFPAAAWGCPLLAAELQILGIVSSQQLSNNDLGRGVFIYLTYGRPPGILPQ